MAARRRESEKSVGPVDTSVIEVGGSAGGGQLLRSALSLSAITGESGPSEKGP